MVDLKSQYLHIKSDVDKAISKVIDSSQFINGDEVTLCLSDPVFSNPSASLVPVSLGDCVDVELIQVIVGDINFDSIINVLDAVILVNAVLNSTPLEDLEMQAADINNDDILNVLDVVQLINIILNP